MSDITEQQRVDWLRKELWTLKDLQELCCGLVDGESRLEEKKEQLQKAREAIGHAELAGSLVPLPEQDQTLAARLYGTNKFYRPAEAIAWASKRFPKEFPFVSADVTNACREVGANAKKDLASRERDTLLLLLAALCNHGAIDWRGRGAAPRIREVVEEFGASMSEDTIRKWLTQMPEAVGKRML